jgi:hypothetical protein
MAKVRLNPILEQVRGQVGDLVFRRYGDEVVIARKPDMSDQEFTPAQLQVQERFRQAALYGKMVMADPDTKALYEEKAEAEGKPVFSLTIADFFNAPSVEEIDLSGYGGAVDDEIVVRADDDFDVEAVDVSIVDDQGDLIESGSATENPPDSSRWAYAVTTPVDPGTAVRIVVTAQDRPGGVGTDEEEKTL